MREDQYALWVGIPVVVTLCVIFPLLAFWK